MIEQSSERNGYDEACNDFATAILEVSGSELGGEETISVKALVDRFHTLRAIRFAKQNIT